MIPKFIVFVSAVSFLPGVAIAQTVEPHLWVAPGLYGLERSECERPVDAAAVNDTAMVDSVFCPLLDRASRQTIGARFVQIVSNHFPNVNATFAGHLPTNSTPRARLASTFVVSLRLTRATIWTIPKGTSTDAFLPITLTLDITNPNTGEVVFTRTRTDIAQGTFSPGSVGTALVGQFNNQLDQAISALVNDAAAVWKPYPISGTVRARVDGGWLLDRGRQAGLREGDSIGADGTVRFAGPDYSVIAPTLGEYTVGQVVSRNAMQPAEVLARPSVLTIVASAPDNYALPYLTQLFEDALGGSGRLAPVPVNPGFSALRTLAVSNAADLSNDARSLPDYIARVNVYALMPSSIPSNVPGVVVNTYEAHVFTELLDRSGRVVFTAHGSNRIVDENFGSIRFAAEQRRDTTIRNALIDAAQKVSAFNQQPVDLPIESEGEQMLVTDPGGVLPLGAQALVLRDLGRVGGVPGVRVPVGQVKIEQITNDGLVASSVGLEPLRIKSGDRVLALNAGLASKTRRSVSQCVDDSGGVRFDDRGGTSPNIWRYAAANSFASRYSAPVFITGLENILRPFETQFAGWDSLPATRTRTVDYCYIPVAAVVPLQQGDKKGPVGRKFAITLGYTLYRGSEKLTGGGLQIELTSTVVPADVALGMSEAILERDFAAAALPIAARAAHTLVPPM